MNELLKELKEKIGEALRDIGLREPGAGRGTVKAPNVFIGIYGRDKFRNQKDFPFVAIVPSEGIVGEESIVYNVSLVCGVFNPDREPEPAVIELGNIMTRVSQHLSRFRILGKRYELKLPIEIYADLEAKHPYYQAEIITRFETANVMREIGTGEMVEEFGAGYE